MPSAGVRRPRWRHPGRPVHRPILKRIQAGWKPKTGFNPSAGSPGRTEQDIGLGYPSVFVVSGREAAVIPRPGLRPFADLGRSSSIRGDGVLFTDGGRRFRVYMPCVSVVFGHARATNGVFTQKFRSARVPVEKCHVRLLRMEKIKSSPRCRCPAA